jgi:hypothetical protein
LYYEDKYIANHLVARNSHGQMISIIALIKFQGSDTKIKIVAQIQSYFEAKGKIRQTINTMTYYTYSRYPNCRW